MGILLVGLCLIAWAMPFAVAVLAVLGALAERRATPPSKAPQLNAADSFGDVDDWLFE
jgi:hypothetical protein